MAKTWVIVAESARARIFEFEKLYSPLSEVKALANLKSRLHEQDLTSDRPGHAFDGKGQGRHALKINSSKTQEAISFAKTISEHLGSACSSGQFDSLVVVAPPDFLGLLRKHMNESTKGCVLEEFGKNLVRNTPVEIRDYLTENLPGKHKL